MKLRLVLAATVAAIGFAPLTAAHAWTCSPSIDAVCSTLGTACRAVPQKYQPFCTFD